MSDILWQKNGGTPGPLPAEAIGADGFVYTDLADNPKGIAQCGYTQAPSQPSFDPTTQQCVWVNGAWVVEAIPAAPVSTVMSRDDFMRLFTVAQAGAIATSTDPTVCAFRFEMTLVSAVDRSDPRTIYAIDYMSTMAEPILSPASEATRILAGEAPPTS